MRRGKKVLPIVFTVILVDMLGVGILIPIIPLLFADPAYPYHLALSASDGYLLLGALTALYPFAQFLATPVIGQLSDTFGRKPLLAFTLFGTAVSYALFAVGIIFRNIPLLFVARALDGITGGNVAVAQASIADTTEHEHRARSFGIIGAANGVGFILGPLFGGFLSDPKIHHVFGAPTPFWFAAGLSFLNMLAVLFFFPETRTHKTKHRIRFAQSFRNIKDALVGKDRRSLYVTSFVFQAGFAFIITFFGVYLIARFGFGQRQIGYLFGFVGLLLAFAQLTLTGPLSKRFRPYGIISASLLVMGVSLIGVYAVHDPILLYVMTIPTAIAAALVLTNLTALISTSSAKSNQGTALGMNSSVQALAQSIPPVFAGGIAAIFAPTTPILFAGGIIIAAGVFFTLTHVESYPIIGSSS